MHLSTGHGALTELVGVTCAFRHLSVSGGCPRPGFHRESITLLPSVSCVAGSTGTEPSPERAGVPARAPSCWLSLAAPGGAESVPLGLAYLMSRCVLCFLLSGCMIRLHPSTAHSLRPRLPPWVHTLVDARASLMCVAVISLGVQASLDVLISFPWGTTPLHHRAVLLVVFEEVFTVSSTVIPLRVRSFSSMPSSACHLFSFWPQPSKW